MKKFIAAGCASIILMIASVIFFVDRTYWWIRRSLNL